MGTNASFLVALDHHPDQRLCAGFAQQDTTAPAHLLGDADAGLLHRGVLERIAFALEAHIDQHLGALANPLARLGQGLGRDA